MAQDQIKWEVLNYGSSSYKCANGAEYIVAEKWLVHIEDSVPSEWLWK